MFKMCQIPHTFDVSINWAPCFTWPTTDYDCICDFTGRVLGYNSLENVKIQSVPKFKIHVFSNNLDEMVQIVGWTGSLPPRLHGGCAYDFWRMC